MFFAEKKVGIVGRAAWLYGVATGCVIPARYHPGRGANDTIPRSRRHLEGPRPPWWAMFRVTAVNQRLGLAQVEGLDGKRPRRIQPRRFRFNRGGY